MTTAPKQTTGISVTPIDLKIIFEALQIAPGYLSKRFILSELLGWSDELIKKNATLRSEEVAAEKKGDRVGAFK